MAMRRLKKLFVIGIVLLLTGCTDFFMICSLNPFYLDKNIHFLPEIEGNWNATRRPKLSESGKDEGPSVWNRLDTTSVWKIKRHISKDTNKTKNGADTIVYTVMNYYDVSLESCAPDSVVYRFKMVLFKVNKGVYADFMPVENSGLEKSRFAAESYFKVHTLARIDLTGEQFKISWLGAEYMKDMIEKKRVRVSYRWVSEAKRLLLTGSSEQLTGMIERYADEPRFVDWENQQAMLKLNRIK
jgi:hypothetical protein